METPTAFPGESQKHSKIILIGKDDGNATGFEVNDNTFLVPLEHHNVDSELHLRNQKLRARQDRKFPTEEAIEEALPEGFSIDSAESFGYSAWAITGKLVARSSNSEKVFFIKAAYGETGRVMLLGEFESSKTIYKLMPDFIPEPFGYGKYKKAELPTYFCMSEFVDFDVTRAQDPANFCKRLAEMHETSQNLSDRFGFRVTTCDGNRPHNVEWEQSWAEFYRMLLLHTLSLDIKKNGSWDKYERAAHQVASKVIPQLLEGLTWKGQPIKPSLIHGDLWEGNTGISKRTNLPMLFDAGSYFAHNEMELGHWASEFSPIFGKQAYMDRYLACFPKAEPVDGFDDRIQLYSLKGGINYSAGHRGSRLRTSAYNSILYLCEKYAPIDGVDKYDESIDPIKTGAKIVSHEELRMS
ncbi:Fructosamine kinase-domain-containing protein [Colletotrichum phormii]|uniref:protein-ribulosamine 3-kinase n=1 Tax=Colletotrichum phormii TaxID=359342 RepID=A0AAJ0EFV4_9PEZI|nr:Fructosamine kinase-domain-containing protein [Colletotrichum phormii]KAK1638602.1 Fructosamine kinase-domain-containing protein [Colletotrichum phormii]